MLKSKKWEALSQSIKSYAIISDFVHILPIAYLKQRGENRLLKNIFVHFGFGKYIWWMDLWLSNHIIQTFYQRIFHWLWLTHSLTAIPFLRSPSCSLLAFWATAEAAAASALGNRLCSFYFYSDIHIKYYILCLRLFSVWFFKKKNILLLRSLLEIRRLFSDIIKH